MIMVRTLNHVYIYVSIATECVPVTSNSTSSVDYDHDPNSDQQEVPIDDYLDESDSFEDEK